MKKQFFSKFAFVSVLVLLLSNAINTQAQVCGVPSPTVTTIGSNYAELSWSSISGALWYTIRYRVSPSGAWVGASATAGSTTKLILGLTPNTFYDIEMKTNCTGGSSAYSTTITFQTLASSTCLTPSPSITGKSINTVSLAWAAISGASNYRVRYRETPSGAWTVGSTSATSKTVTDLNDGTQYEFQVQAVCTYPDESAYSTGIFETTCDSVFVTSTSPICNGSSSSLNATSAGSYTYTWNPGSLSGATVSVSPTFTQNYTVTATAAGCSGTRVVNVVVDNPTMITTTGSYSSTRIQSNNTTLAYNDLANCNLIGKIKDDNNATALGSTTFSCIYGSLDQSTLPERMISSKKFTIIPTTTDGGIITLYFNQADFDEYNTYNSTTLSNFYLPLPTTGSNADPNIANFRIIKIQGAAISGFSNPLMWDATNNRWEAQITSTDVEGTYGFYTLTSCVGVNVSGFAETTHTGNSASFSWTAVTVPASGWYEFQYENVTDNPGVWVFAGTASNSATSKTIVGLSGNKNYNFQIRRACNNAAKGDWSSSVNLTTNATCAKPTNLAATTTTTTAALSWDAVSGVSWYVVRYRETPSGSWVAGSASTNSKNIAGLSASTAYEFEVQAKCAGGLDVSDWSDPFSFTTPSSKSAIASNDVFGNSISLYPNPVIDNAQLEISSEVSTAQVVKLFDVSGRLVKEVHTQIQKGNNVVTIEMNELTKGLYLIEVFDANGQKSYHQKIQKN
ncbi:MAG: fibronectin type III domain-containing protein [Chitinophagaceae bacterium]